MIITAPIFDPNGEARIVPLKQSDLNNFSRRVNRIATLDGGAVMNDGGYSDADQTFRVSFKKDGQFENIKRMFQLYPLLNISHRNSFYTAAPENIVERDGLVTITLLIMKKHISL